MELSATAAASLVLFLSIGLLITVLLVTLHTIYVLTHPYRRTYASALARSRPGDPSELPPGPHGPRTFTSWTFAHRGLSLPVWDCPGEDPRGPIVILSHGWGDSRIGGLSRLVGLAPFASRVILWDMPGHGDAPGVCSLGTLEVAALFTLIEHVDRPVVLYGWSLGAGVSIAAAAVAPHVQGVIAEAPYRHPETPARNVLSAFGLPWKLNLPLALGALGVRFGVGPAWKGFDRAEIAGSLGVPLLVVHGAEDDICPPVDGQAIADAAPAGSFVLIQGAGHHGLWTDPAAALQCRTAVSMFMAPFRDFPSGA